MRNVQLSQIWEQLPVKHLVKISQFTAGKVQVLNSLHCVSSKSRFKNLISEPSRKCLLGLNTFRVLNAEPVQDPKPSEVEDAIDPVILLPDQIVARNVENNQPGQLFEIDDLLDVVNHVVAEIELH